MQLRESIRHSNLRVMHQPHVLLFFFVKQAGLRIRAKTELLQNALAQRAPITAAHASSSITKQYLQCSAAAAAAAIPGIFLHLSNLGRRAVGRTCRRYAMHPLQHTVHAVLQLKLRDKACVHPRHHNLHHKQPFIQRYVRSHLYHSTRDRKLLPCQACIKPHSQATRSSHTVPNLLAVQTHYTSQRHTYNYQLLTTHTCACKVKVVPLTSTQRNTQLSRCYTHYLQSWQARNAQGHHLIA